jgi:hypothetical protein
LCADSSWRQRSSMRVVVLFEFGCARVVSC